MLYVSSSMLTLSLHKIELDNAQTWKNDDILTCCNNNTVTKTHYKFKFKFNLDIIKYKKFRIKFH